MSSEGVLLPDECVTGVRDALGSGGVLLSDECVLFYRHTRTLHEVATYYFQVTSISLHFAEHILLIHPAIRASSHLSHTRVQHVAKHLRQLSEVRSVVWVHAPTCCHAFIPVEYTIFNEYLVQRNQHLTLPLTL